MSKSKTAFDNGIIVNNDDRLSKKSVEISPGGTVNTKTTIVSTQTTNKTLTLPDATDTIVGRATTDTLTNKTLTSPNINEAVALTVTSSDLNQLLGVTVGGTSAGDIATIDGTQTLTNKTLTSPNINEAVALTSTATELNQLNGVTVGGNTAGDIVTTDGSQTLSNKTLSGVILDSLDSNLTIQDNVDNTKQMQFELSGITTSTTRTLTIPDANTTLVGQDTTDTLTNKTIDGNNNTISNLNHGAEVDNPTSGVHGVTGNVVGTSDVQTLTNKTLTSPNVNEAVALTATATELNQLDGVTVGGTGAGDILTLNGSQTISNKVIGTSNSITTQDVDFIIRDNADATKQFRFENSNITTGNTRILTVPDADTTLVGQGTTDTLTNKTFDDAIIGQQIATPSNPSAGYNKLYFKSDDSLYKLSSDGIEEAVGGGGGSGQGSINYIDNFDFENSTTTGWATYDDGAVAAPVDGTAGSPTALTISNAASTSLIGTRLFRLTKSAADAQGEGASYDFNIDSALTNKPLYISAYMSASANFVADDVTVYVYDVTNATLINVKSQVSVGGGSNKFTGVFYASDSTSYRLIFHVATTNALAWTLDLDNFSVIPQSVVDGNIIEDWKTVTVTSNYTTNQTLTGFYKRVGDTAFVMVKADLTGTPGGTTGAWELNISNIGTIDTSKLPSAQGFRNILGSANFIGTANYESGIAYFSTTSVVINEDGANGSWRPDTSLPEAWDNGDRVSLEFAIPILEWANQSSVLSSNEMLNQTAKLRRRTSAGQSIPTAVRTFVDYETNDYNFGNITYTSGAGYNAGTGTWTTDPAFTVADAGQYRVTVFSTFATTSTWDTGEVAEIRVVTSSDGTHYVDRKDGETDSSRVSLSGAVTVNLTANSTIKIQIRNDTGGALPLLNDGLLNLVNIERIPDFSVYSVFNERLDDTQITFGNGDGGVSQSADFVFDDTLKFLGVGGQPSATWDGPTHKGITLNTNGALWGNSVSTHISQNALFDGTNYKYITTDEASDYYQLNGTHVFRTAASDTAGNTVSWTTAMAIASSGNVGINESTPAKKLEVNGGFGDNAFREIVSNSDVSGGILFNVQTIGGNVYMQGLQGGTTGQVIFITKPAMANTLTFVHLGTGTQTFRNPSATDIVIPAGGYGGVTLVYTGGFWIPVGIAN